MHREGAFNASSPSTARPRPKAERFTDELQHEVQKDDIAVTTFIPGDTGTRFWPGERRTKAVVGAAYADWLERGPYWNGMMQVEAVAEQIALLP